jgi:hypothetical protein
MWESLTREDAVQTVSSLAVEVDPDWTALVASGWQPADPAMTIVAVTGTLTVEEDGQSRTCSMAFTLALGSAASHPGYGAVAVDDWTVS